MVQREEGAGQHRVRRAQVAFHHFRFGNTPYPDQIRDRQKKTATGPVFLQDHGNPVKFRNVWVLPAGDRAFVCEPGEQ